VLNLNIQRVLKVRAGFWVIFWKDRFYACGYDQRTGTWKCSCSRGTHNQEELT
jgi:hypothetical protein